MKRNALHKRIRAAALLFLAVAALGILAVALSRADNGSPEEDAVNGGSSAGVDEPGYIINGTIRALTIWNEHGEITIRAGEAGEQARIPALERFPQDTGALSALLYRVSHLRAQGTLEGIENLEPFGLSPPQAELAIDLEDGGQRFLEIGAAAPDGKTRYVRAGDAGGGTEVQLVELYDLERCFDRALDFLDLAVTPAPDGDGQTLTFERIELGGLCRGKEPVTVVYAPPDAAFSAAPGINNPYRVTSPLEANLSLDRAIQPLEALFGLTADRVAAVLESPAARARYGLDKPYSTAEVWGAEYFRLAASAPDDAGQVYLTREGRDLVYTIAASKLPWLDSSFFDLMEKLVVIPFIDTVAAVEVIDHDGGGAFTFELAGEGDALTARSGDMVIETAQFRALYQTLVSARYDEYYDGSLPTGAAPRAEIRYRYRDGRTPDRVAFYPASSRRVLTALNGGRPFFTHAAYVDTLLKDCALLREGKQVQPYL